VRSWQRHGIAPDGLWAISIGGICEMSKRKKKNVRTFSYGVIWVCPSCCAYNLNEVGWEDFECISCGYLIHAEAHTELGEVVE